MNAICESPNSECPGHDRLRNHWLVACDVSSLSKKPLARTVLGNRLVLFESHSDVVAMRDRCSHRNAPLSEGRTINGCIQCPYHGWQFDARGRCVVRPGVTETLSQRTTIETFPTMIQDGYVWVCLEDPVTPHPARRPWRSDRTFESFRWTDTVEASFADALENLLDGTHTPFVHSGLVRSAGQSQTFSAIVRVQSGIAEAEYVNEGKQAGWISRVFERHRASSFGRFVPPCLAELEYTSARGAEFVLNSFFTPESVDRLQVHSTIYLRRSLIPISLKKLAITPFFRRVLKQDQHILMKQQDNIRHHGGRCYQSWEGDLLRGWIDTWLRTGELPDQDREHRIDFDL